MEKRPKRRKMKDNPYTLGFDKEKQIYIVSFNDNKNTNHTIEISESMYNTFNQFELEDLSILNEYDNHIEHSEIYEENLHKRAIKREATLEEIVEKKLIVDRLNSAIQDLPDIQQRRLKKYYFDEKTFEEIAKEEKCTKRAVKFSVDIAIQKISKKFQK